MMNHPWKHSLVTILFKNYTLTYSTKLCSTWVPFVLYSFHKKYRLALFVVWHYILYLCIPYLTVCSKIQGLHYYQLSINSRKHSAYRVVVDQSMLSYSITYKPLQKYIQHLLWTNNRKTFFDDPQWSLLFGIYIPALFLTLEWRLYLEINQQNIAKVRKYLVHVQVIQYWVFCLLGTLSFLLALKKQGAMLEGSMRPKNGGP